MAEGKQAESTGVRVTAGIVGVLLLVGMFFLVKSCGSVSSTTVKGHFYVDYVVLAPAGVRAPVSVTFTDPGSGDIKSVTVDTLPWAKDFEVNDPNAINARFSVDDGNNINGVTCTVVVNRTVLVEKAINGGDSGTCAVLHF